MHHLRSEVVASMCDHVLTQPLSQLGMHKVQEEEQYLRSQVVASMSMYSLMRPSTHTTRARSDTGASSEPMRTTLGLYTLPCKAQSIIFQSVMHDETESALACSSNGAVAKVSIDSPRVPPVGADQIASQPK